MPLQLIAPRENELRAHVLNVGRLKVVQLLRVVRAVVEPQRVAGGKCHLFQLEVNRLVDSLNELGYGGVHTVQCQVLFGYLGLQFAKQVRVERLLCLLDFCE